MELRNSKSVDGHALLMLAGALSCLKSVYVNEFCENVSIEDRQALADFLKGRVCVSKSGTHVGSLRIKYAGFKTIADCEFDILVTRLCTILHRFYVFQ